jgi:molybdenum cofactor cytidylyltransferase
MAETVAVLLAAGESRRMGQLKALLPWQGVSLLLYQVNALKDAGVDRVVVIVGHQAERLQTIVEGQEGVSLVFNPDYLEGKTTSIKAGVKAAAARNPAALVVPITAREDIPLSWPRRFWMNWCVSTRKPRE